MSNISNEPYPSELQTLPTEFFFEQPFVSQYVSIIDFVENYLRGEKRGEVIVALNKIGLPLEYLKKLYVDANLIFQPNIGGYYETSQDFIGLNPLIFLLGKGVDISHIVIHEQMHAGAFTNGVNIWDESFVEFLTLEKLDELYKEEGALRSRYGDLVCELRGRLNTETLFEQFEELIDQDDTKTLNNLLSKFVLEPILKNEGAHGLNEKNIYYHLNRIWDIIVRLFPRLINQIEGKSIDIDIGAKTGLSSYRFDDLLDLAGQMIESGGLIETLAWETFDLGQNFPGSLEQMHEVLIRKGFGYILHLFDFNEVLLLLHKKYPDFELDSQLLQEF